MPDEPVTHTPAWPMYRAMVGTGMACALLIAGVYGWTKPVIAAKRAAALAAAVYEVLPGADHQQGYALRAGSLVPVPDAEADVHAAFQGEGLVGWAVPAEGMGYQDTIKILYGLDAREPRVIGFKVLQSRETPGLGDRIAFDPAFLANFKALDVTPVAGGGLRNPVIAVKAGTKTAAWQVDGISGATVSSAAVADILHASATKWGSLLRQPAPSRQEVTR